MKRVMGGMLHTSCDLNPSWWDEMLSKQSLLLAMPKPIYRKDSLHYELRLATRPLHVWEMYVLVPASKRYAQSLKQRLADAQRCLKQLVNEPVDYYDRSHRTAIFSPRQSVLLGTKNLRSRATGH